MPKAIRIHKAGGPEVLQWEDVSVGDPGPGEARVRHHAVGLNYTDVYYRMGLYPLPYPSGLGLEASGMVEAVGAGVRKVAMPASERSAGGRPGTFRCPWVTPSTSSTVTGTSAERSASAIASPEGRRSSYSHTSTSVRGSPSTRPQAGKA